MPPKSKKPAKPTTKTPAPAATTTAAGLPTTPPTGVSLNNFPPLVPLLPPSSLIPEVLIPNQLVTIPQFFTTKLCNTLVEWFSRNIQLETTPARPKKGFAARVNDRLAVEDWGLAERLWGEGGVGEVVKGMCQVEGEGDEERERRERELWGGKVVGLNPNMRVYRYGEGQFFDKHYDDYNTLSTSSGEIWKTTWTLLIYLTGTADGVVGGETVFYTEATKRKKSEEVVVPLVKGTALLHRHGKECMLHEGRVVEDAGVGGRGKWVLRSDLCVKMGK